MKRIPNSIKKGRAYLFALFILSALVFFMNYKKCYLAIILIIALVITPLFLSFEKYKTSPKSLVLIAMLSAISALSRLIFAAIPQVKPTAALVIISGICLGAKSGFLIGNISVFISNLFLGQGIWTPWQMLAFGLLGLLAGLIFEVLPHKINFICIYGGLSVLLIYGTIINVASFFLFTENASFNAFIIYLIASLPMDIMHSLSTAIFLLFLSKPIILQIKRFNNTET